MIGELALRFVLGGIIVSLFAVTGEMFEPKTFAGIFGAAPSVALATLALASWKHGGEYVATEAQSMLLGSFALFVYGAACVATTRRRELPVCVGGVLAWGAWGAVAFGLWGVAHALGALQ
jgi:uncharacterized membrane protein (GlpM family)